MLNKYRFHSGQFTVSLNEIRFTGSDTKSFLQAQSTYDINKISPESFQLISFLDAQARLECYGWLVFKNNHYSYLVPTCHITKTIERLNRFLISEDVELSMPELREITFVLGPEMPKTGVQGIMFGEEALLIELPSPYIETIPDSDIELWRALTGWPSFDGSDFSHELFNNLRLYDLSLLPNKGCYPGQETVAKIATRRGAAFSPVLIETDSRVETGDIYSFDKKVGTSSGCYQWKDHFYITAALLRDFRVAGMKVQFLISGKEVKGLIRYYPLLDGDKTAKAQEIYYEASDHFKRDELERAEECYRLAIKLDPTFADAYESLGVMLGRQERFQEAVDIMKMLSDVDPKSVLAHTNMSLFLMRLGKITEAEEQKSLATIKSFQSFGDEAKLKEAQTFKKKQQEAEWEERESMFKQVLEIDQDDTLANYGIGSIAVEKGEWDTACAHLEKVLLQDAKYSVAYLALGKAYKALGRIEDAKKIWEEGIKISAAKGDLMPANQMQQELSFF